jgi:hypothetical protein
VIKEIKVILEYRVLKETKEIREIREMLEKVLLYLKPILHLML